MCKICERNLARSTEEGKNKFASTVTLMPKLLKEVNAYNCNWLAVLIQYHKDQFSENFSLALL